MSHFEISGIDINEEQPEKIQLILVRSDNNNWEEVWKNSFSERKLLSFIYDIFEISDKLCF